MSAEQDQFVTDRYQAKRMFLLEYAESSLHNYALSEDAVQQTFEIACYKIEDFCNSPNPDGWLTKALSLVIRNMEKHQRVERRVIAVTDDYRPNLVAAPEVPAPLRVTYGPLVETPQFRLAQGIVGKANRVVIAVAAFYALGDSAHGIIVISNCNAAVGVCLPSQIPPGIGALGDRISILYFLC